MDNVNGFGERLLALREERKETQQQLADAIGITRQSLSRYETNERTPNIDLIYSVSKHYNVSADYLLGLSEVKSLDNSIKIAKKTTGLTEDAIKTLQYMCEHEPLFMTVFCKLLEDEIKIKGDGLFIRIARYFCTTPTSGKIIIDKNGAIRIGKNKEQITPIDKYVVDLQKLANERMINDIINCLYNYTKIDEYGHKSFEFAEYYNINLEFQSIMTEEDMPLSIIEKIKKERDSNANNNPSEE